MAKLREDAVMHFLYYFVGKYLRVPRYNLQTTIPMSDTGDLLASPVK